MATKNASAAAAPSVAASIAAPDAAPALTFDSVEARMSAITALGVAGKEYVQKLTELLDRRSNGTVQVEKIPYRIESISCIDVPRKQAVIIVFNESYVATQANVPVTEYMPEVCAAFKAKNPDVTMIQYIVVRPEDYTRVENMSAHVINCFLALDPNNYLSADMFRNMRLTPTTDIKQVKSFIELHSAHAVQDRADWGVLINRVIQSTRVNEYQNMKEPELRPIIAIAGYTRFLRLQDNGITKYLPVCIITNVTSTVPSTDILNIALPIVAGCIIQQHVWLRPYTKFTKGSPNLGRLRLTADGKNLDWFQNIDQMNAEIPKFMFRVPMLAMDCAEGRARIPGVEAYVISGSEAIMNNVNRFFGPAAGAQFAALGQSATAINFFSYEGSYKADGQIMDTRNGDFINMVTSTGDYARCSTALVEPMRMPAKHITDIASIYGEDAVTPLYRVHTIVFNSYLINILANLVSGIVNYTSESCINQNVDIGALLAQFQTQIGGNNAIYGGVMSNNTPGNLYC